MRVSTRPEILAPPARLWGAQALRLVAGLLVVGCQNAGGAPETPQSSLAPSIGRKGLACEVKLNESREMRESAAPGSPRDNVRRFYAKFEVHGEVQRRLLCRETDSNYDGVMDIVRVYDDEGRPHSELVDSNYDGRVDTWITFVAGMVGTLGVDRDHDGKADEKRFFVDGKLARVQQDTNGDGQVDRFEIYRDERLERVGVDADFDGRVDRWDRDASSALSASEAGEGKTTGNKAATAGGKGSGNGAAVPPRSDEPAANP